MVKLRFLLLQVVVHEAELRHFLVLRAWLAVVGKGIDAYAATGKEDACHLDVTGFHQSDEVFHYDIDTILVETAVVSEREEVEFQAFALNHPPVGKVVDAYLGEVRLPRDGTERRELGAVETHPIVVLGMLVLEGLQHVWIVILRYFALLA